MSSASGPSIATSGLVLDFDMNNTQKSWKGAPTTNLTPNMGIVAIQAAPALTYIGVEDGWKKYSLNGTWTAGTYPYSIAVDAITFTGGVTYSTGVYIKTNVPTKFAALFTGMNYVNQPQNLGGTSFSITQSDGSIYVGRYGFQYTGTSSQNGYLVSQPVVGQAFSSATDFIYIKQGQIEVGSFLTPFIAGTRSTTQAIVDLTNNNTLTATSLTYASDNTFSFDGNSNYLQGTGSCGITGSVTLSAVIKPSYSGQTGPHSTIICTDVNYPYGAKLMNFKNTARYGLWLGFSGVDNYEAFIGTDINDNITKMLTASWDQSTGIVNIYLNGILQSSIATAKTIPTVLLDGKITVGTDYNSIGSAAKNKFLGNIYYASIHNRALSANEVAQNFNAIRSRYGL